MSREISRLEWAKHKPASNLPPDEIEKIKATNPACVYLQTLSAGPSRRGMSSRLNQIVAMLTGRDDLTYLDFPWHCLRYRDIESIRNTLVESGVSQATVSLTLSALRGVLQTAFRMEMLSAEDLMRVTSVKPNRAVAQNLPPGRALSKIEVELLFATCDGGAPSDVRDKAILALLFGAGLRREEIAELKTANLDLLEGYVRFRGKGQKERQVPLPEGSIKALKAWLDLRGSKQGQLFFPVNKASRIVRESRHITPQTIYNVLKKRSLQAGIKRCSPHDARRTYTSNMIDLTQDLSLVQKLLGHSSVETTAKYDRRGEEAKRKAVSALKIP